MKTIDSSQKRTYNTYNSSQKGTKYGLYRTGCETSTKTLKKGGNLEVSHSFITWCFEVPLSQQLNISCSSSENLGVLPGGRDVTVTTLVVRRIER